ncbi:MAG: hypothetical protein KC897_02670 [Candidatus Omnitrophica bacterium]|nr:hypothetical protein [Candidatus Omnitrophota bacterium]MCB9722175.1 hypothetical protein [Candidatus Omnitrophota bacterium]
MTYIDDPNSQEERCDCGKLLFKMTPRGLEFKCNRCKQIHLVPIHRLDAEFRNICPVIDQESHDSKKS